MSNISAAAIARDARKRAGLTQRDLAARAHTTQAAIARIEAADTIPSFETLRRLLDAAGFDLRVDIVQRAASDPVVEAYKRDIDRTLLIENLRRTVDERLRINAEVQLFGNELKRALRVAERKR
jgi:transcriptional regulator with XRE-family HTH domain